MLRQTPNTVNHALQQALSEHFEELNRTHPLYTIRQQAMQNFQERDLSATQGEAYKHTPVAGLLAAHPASGQPSASVSITPDSVTAVHYHDIDAYHVVLLDGHVSDRHTQLSGQEQYIQVLTFQEAYQQQQNIFLEHFSQHAQSKEDPFTALNTALFGEGIFIRIADNAIIDKPVLLYHCTTTSTHQPPTTYPRLLVVAGKRSQASIITSWQTTAFTNAVAEVVLQENAQIDYYTLQTMLGDQACQVTTTQCYQAAHSTLNAYTFTWSGALVRNNLNSVIDASHSTINMYGLYCLHKRQHVDNCTTVDHRKPYTYSNELYKGIMMDASTGVFNGRICVRAEAQKTNAFQKNDNLLLSDHATLHTKPQLEIWADDVKCSHGATTGQLDQEQLFYLRARGLPENVAHHLLQQAFASEVMEKVPLVALRTRLYDSLAAQVQ